MIFYDISFLQIVAASKLHIAPLAVVEKQELQEFIKLMVILVTYFIISVIQPICEEFGFV